MRHLLVFVWLMFSSEFIFSQEIHLDPTTTSGTLVVNSSVELSDGNRISVGFNASGVKKATIVRYNNGGVVWSRAIVDTILHIEGVFLQIADCSFNKVILTSNGDLVAVGFYQQDALIIRFNSSGNLIWAKVLGANNVPEDRIEQFRSVAEDSTTGDIVAVGIKDGNSMGSNLWRQAIARFNSSGVLQYWKVVNPANPGVPYTFDRVFVKNDSTFVFGSEIAVGPTSRDICIFAFDSSGNVLLHKVLGGPTSEHFLDAVEYGNGFIVSYRFSNSQSIGLIRLSPGLAITASTLWYGNSSWILSGGYLATNSTEVYLSGNTRSPGTPSSSYSFVSKIHPTSLTEIWNQTIHLEATTSGSGIAKLLGGFEATSFKSPTQLGSVTGALLTNLTSSGFIIGACEIGPGSKPSLVVDVAGDVIYDQAILLPSNISNFVNRQPNLSLYSPIFNTCDIGPLPVELVSFTAKAVEKTSLLEWSTASELNNSHFKVMRSSNAVNFEEIGRVAGVGTTQQSANYEFVDGNPLNGTNYYKLVQVDYDGTSKGSNVETVLHENSLNVSVFPNPIGNGGTLNIVGEFLSFQIFDQSSRKIFEGGVNHRFEFYGNPGLYMVVVFGEKGISTTTKLIVQ